MSLVGGVNSLLGSHLIGPSSGDLLSASPVDGTLSGPPLADGFLRILSGPSAADQSHTTPVDLLSFTDTNHGAPLVSALLGNQATSLADIDLASGSYGQSSAVDFNLGPDWNLPSAVGTDIFQDGKTDVSVLGHQIADLSPIAQATGLDPIVNGVLSELTGPVHSLDGTLGTVGHGLDVGSLLDVGNVLGAISGGASGGLNLGGVVEGVTGGLSLTGGTGGTSGGIDLGGLTGGLGLGEILGGGSAEGSAHIGLGLGDLLGHHGLLG